MTFAPSISPPPWRPVLRGDLAEQALEAVRAIAGGGSGRSRVRAERARLVLRRPRHRLRPARGGAGSLTLAAAARHWLQRALDARCPGVGIGGFQAWRRGPGDAPGWWGEPGFLMGSAGIGLALLAAVSPVEPDWDRLLLVSVSPRV